jgi:hypothetical protein
MVKVTEDASVGHVVEHERATSFSVGSGGHLTLADGSDGPVAVYAPGFWQTAVVEVPAS